MMNLNMDMDKRTIIGIGAIVAVIIIFIGALKPLWSKVNRVSNEVSLLNDELSGIRGALRENKNLKVDRHPLARGEVSVAINEIMEVGTSLNIDFFSTNPEQIQKIVGSNYPTLPIRMELQSTYKNFGVFLGSLESLNKSIVTVKRFNISREPMILPEISVDLVVEIHLKEGEGG